MCEQTHSKTVCRGPWRTARSQEGSSAPSLAELEAPLGGRQRPLPSVSLVALSLAGPLVIPATNNPASLHRMTWSQGHRRCRTCPQAEVPTILKDGPASALPLGFPVQTMGLLVPLRSTWLPLGGAMALRRMRGFFPLASLVTSDRAVQWWGTWPALLRLPMLGASKEEVGATVGYTAVVMAHKPYFPMRKLLLGLILDINFVATQLGLLPHLSLYER